jgi:hypothetical protein
VHQSSFVSSDIKEPEKKKTFFQYKSSEIVIK